MDSQDLQGHILSKKTQKNFFFKMTLKAESKLVKSKSKFFFQFSMKNIFAWEVELLTFIHSFKPHFYIFHNLYRLNDEPGWQLASTPSPLHSLQIGLPLSPVFVYGQKNYYGLCTCKGYQQGKYIAHVSVTSNSSVNFEA